MASRRASSSAWSYTASAALHLSQRESRRLENASATRLNSAKDPDFFQCLQYINNLFIYFHYTNKNCNSIKSSFFMVMALIQPQPKESCTVRNWSRFKTSTLSHASTLRLRSFQRFQLTCTASSLRHPRHNPLPSTDFK